MQEILKARMIHITSAEHYSETKARAAAGSLGLVVHFSADWCEPCGVVRAELERQAAAYGPQLLVAEVDAVAQGGIAESEGVESVPFIIFFRTPAPASGGAVELERVADVAGAKLDLLSMNLVSLYGENGKHRGDFAALDDYLKYLTTRKGVVAFITGSPSRPRCGFTGKLCEMLQSLGAPFIYYDVMASDEVCEGLKRYSDWPTYPQVYVDGELIGGWDICREMNEKGELKAALKL